MKLVRLNLRGECDCGRPLEATVLLKRGGQSPVACACGFSLMIAAPKEKPTRVSLDLSTNDVRITQVGDEAEPDPDDTKH